jgi:hypothetical protein
MAIFQVYAMDLKTPFQQEKEGLYEGNTTQDKVSDVDGRPGILLYVFLCVGMSRFVYTLYWNIT